MASDVSTTMNNIDDRARLVGDPSNSHPLVIFFHGSGDSCTSWAPLAELLSSTCRVLMWDRQEHNPKPEQAVREMLNYLAQAELPPPYVLVAHSYGGTFARLFLQQRPDHVAGMVLVETGQETALDAKVEQQQYRKRILGDRPLVVIRGNTLIGKWKQYEEAVAAESNGPSQGLLAQRELLDATDKEDERLKKAQLALSSNNRYIHIPDCGHNVIQQKPEAVAEEVRWVMENLSVTGNSPTTPRTIWRWLRSKFN